MVVGRGLVSALCHWTVIHFKSSLHINVKVKFPGDKRLVIRSASARDSGSALIRAIKSACSHGAVGRD